MDDELKEKLASWKVQPEIPPDFQRGVWNRIAAREARSAKPHFLTIWAIRLIRTPALAACAVALSALTGAGLGLVESNRANIENWKTLETKYVQSIDPYEHLRSY
jgi:type VI protein secretion system component VasK